jgi:tRNA A-37 threonylcarbamoyl transferase component Bud32
VGRVAAADPRVGSQFAGYRIVGLVGRGATSSVYRAVELRLEREVALKLLSPELSEDRRFERRFLRESKLAASLEHPNVIPIFAAGQVEDQLYIAMRLIEGGDLKTLLDEHRRLPKERALALCAQLASALDAAHTSGLVHRDVKPSNVLLERDSARKEHAFLADFGLTKAAAATRASTQTGRMIGTIDYMAPEQIRGDDVDGRADLYSLGCLLYECLVGEPPFTRGSEVATLYAHLHDAPPRASEQLPVLPPALDDVFARALAKEPARRYETCGELVAAARTALGLPEHDTGAWSLRPRRRRIVLAVAGIAVAAAAATALALAVGGGGHAVAATHHRVSLPGYRVTATERITSGAPGAYPIVGLYAAVDDGKGPVTANQSARPTGEIVFRFDVDQFEATGGDIAGAAPGATLGYVVSWVTSGGTFVQLPVRKSGLTDGDVVHATVELPADYRPLGPTIPLNLRLGPGELVATLPLQDVVRKTRAIGGSTKSSKYTGLFLVDSARNPFEATRFTASVSARPCSNVDCSTLGPPASDAIYVALPQELSVHAPARAFYGQPATFSGTGIPGKTVNIVYTGKPGSAPACTPSTVRPHRCGPRLGPAWIGDDNFRTTVRSDGSWSLALPLTPASGDGFGPAGRYSAVEWSDESLVGGALFGGDSSVIQEAAQNTVVALAKPSLTLERRGNQLAVGISVKGGDSLVSYRLRWRGRDLAAGRLTRAGTATELVPLPAGEGPIEVIVSAPGTRAASMSKLFLR